MREALAALVQRRDLAEEQVAEIIGEMLAGDYDDVLAGAFLIALRMKGETAGEIAAAAAALRKAMVGLETGRDDLLDTCGTGGDASGTFNISTATAFVAAAAGVPVVKHGNRAVSSRSGSADVLAALGIEPREDPAWVRRCLDTAGLAFCFAPHFHPAMRHVAPVRTRLKVGTLFNCLGPLANPAGAAYQLIGVGRRELLDPVAGALARLGTRHALVVCGQDGLDEVSLSAPTLVREVRGSSVTAHEWMPEDFGLARCTPADLAASGPTESAVLIRGVLAGRRGPAADIVLANAAAALLAADRVRTVKEGVDRAAEVVRTGQAAEVLERLVACCH